MPHLSKSAIQTLLRVAVAYPDRIADIAASVADELTRAQSRTWGLGDEIPLDVAHVHEPETGVVWNRCTDGPTLSDRIWQTAAEERYVLQRSVQEGLPQDSPRVADDVDLTAQRRDTLTALQLGIDALVMVTNGRRNRALFSAALKALRVAAEAELAGES